MGKYEKIYQELRKKYTDEEIADSMLIPPDLTPEEREQANEEMRAFRFKLLAEMTENDKIFSKIVQLRVRMGDYGRTIFYKADKSFGKYLAKYMEIVKRTEQQFAEDLAIDCSQLSRFMKDEEEPTIPFMYRLEAHSDNKIPAALWWKLVTKRQVFLIRKDVEMRAIEYGKVKNYLRD